MSLIEAITRDIQIVERDVIALIDAARRPFKRRIPPANYAIEAARAALDTAFAAIDDRPWEFSFPDVIDLDPTSIYFIKRTDNTVYATLTNRYLPGEVVLDSTVVHRFSPDWSIQESPVVDEHLKKLQARVGR